MKTDYELMLDNLTATQTRCTELIQETRALQARMNGLVQVHELCLEELSKAKSDLALVRTTDDNVWRWMNGETSGATEAQLQGVENDLETMSESLPVILRAGDLRRMLKKAHSESWEIDTRAVYPAKLEGLWEGKVGGGMVHGPRGEERVSFISEATRQKVDATLEVIEAVRKWHLIRTSTFARDAPGLATDSLEAVSLAFKKLEEGGAPSCTE
jgi:hypothetical protein